MSKPDSITEVVLEKTIFASRWLQAPLYVGLIIAPGVYVCQFFIEVKSPLVAISNHGVMWQVIIHVVFVVSAIALAWTDRLMMAGVRENPNAGH